MSNWKCLYLKQNVIDLPFYIYRLSPDIALQCLNMGQSIDEMT